MYVRTTEEKRQLDELFTRLYTELHGLAKRLRWQSSNATLNATAIVNEAYVRLLNSPLNTEKREYDELIDIFAHLMREILADASRRKKAQKRVPVIIPKPAEFPIEDAVLLSDLLEALKSENPRQGRVVDCRFYLGLTVPETAAALGISAPTVEREWRDAKHHLNGKMVQRRGTA